MSSYENSSLTEIEAVLDGLDEATSTQVFDATRSYASRAIAAVAASRADATGASPIQVVKVALTDAQIKALPSTPVTILETDIDHIIIPLWFTIEPTWWWANPDAAAYSNYASDNSTGFVFNDPVTGNDVSEYLEFGLSYNRHLLDIPGPFPKSNNSRSAYVLRPLNSNFVSSAYFQQVTGASDVDNEIRFSAYNSGGDFTDGHSANTITVGVYYVLYEVE